MSSGPQHYAAAEAHLAAAEVSERGDGELLLRLASVHAYLAVAASNLDGVMWTGDDDALAEWRRATRQTKEV